MHFKMAISVFAMENDVTSTITRKDLLFTTMSLLLCYIASTCIPETIKQPISRTSCSTCARGGAVDGLIVSRPMEIATYLFFLLALRSFIKPVLNGITAFRETDKKMNKAKNKSQSHLTTIVRLQETKAAEAARIAKATETTAAIKEARATRITKAASVLINRFLDPLLSLRTSGKIPKGTTSSSSKYHQQLLQQWQNRGSKKQAAKPSSAAISTPNDDDTVQSSPPEVPVAPPRANDQLGELKRTSEPTSPMPPPEEEVKPHGLLTNPIVTVDIPFSYFSNPFWMDRSNKNATPSLQPDMFYGPRVG